MKHYEKPIKRNTVYEGIIVNVRRDTAEIEGGKHVPREVVEHSGGVGIVPVCDNGDVLMVRQYRYAMSQELLEIPAGKLGFGEEPVGCAVRELKEETGCESEEWELLTQVYEYTTKDTHIIYYFLAKNCVRTSDQNLDENEELTLKWVPFQDAVDMVISDEVKHGCTAYALLRYMALRQKNQKN